MQQEVASIQEGSPGIPDEEVLRRSVEEDRILITRDKDFGELVFKEQQPHVGIVLLRLTEDDPATTTAAILDLLEFHRHRLAGNFTVTTGRRVRTV